VGKGNLLPGIGGGTIRRRFGVAFGGGDVDRRFTTTKRGGVALLAKHWEKT
jgi:hypothetical protein